MEGHGRPSAATHLACVGVGAGPANLSLACLLHGHRDLANTFFERRAIFSWHDGQLFPGSSLQVSMVKDLVSVADPGNGFSFLAYLHDQGRLYHYLNAQFDAVPRQEFRNYLEWACHRNDNVVLGEEVLSVDFDGTFVVKTSARTVTADNVVVGAGTEPWVPPHVRPLLDDTQFHMSEFLTRPRDLADSRVVVVGGGQSGAEAFLELISRPAGERPRRTVWISRRPNYLPLDDSSFTNDYFMPVFSEYFSRLDVTARRFLNESQSLASDGISERTLRAVYQRLYLNRFVDGAADACTLLPARDVVAVNARRGGGWELAMRHRWQPDVVEQVVADVVVWATGMRPSRMDFLAPVAGRMEREDDEYKLDEHFAAVWDGPPGHHIFIQNAARQQRGLADPNLSLLAWRSQRIADRLRGAEPDRLGNSFIAWSADMTGIAGPTRDRQEQ